MAASAYKGSGKVVSLQIWNNITGASANQIASEQDDRRLAIACDAIEAEFTQDNCCSG
jgi:hypothetical protein